MMSLICRIFSALEQFYINKTGTSKVGAILKVQNSPSNNNSKCNKRPDYTVSTLNEAHQMLNEQPIEID